jgi:hypothetical protein
MAVTEILKKAMGAHGGEQYWRSLEAVEAVLSVHGLLFTLKHVPVMKRVRVRALTREPRFTFFDFPRQGYNGEYRGDEEVVMVDGGGNVVERRTQPRRYFSEMRRMFSWDALDFVYFGGYATWNYLTTPFLFLRDGFTFEEMGSFPDPSGPLTRLRVTFPEEIPTHSRMQTFYFDGKGLLRRLDYTAEVIGGWAHAAHLCDQYKEFGPLRFPTRRRVRPIMAGDKPLPWPTLVAIDVHEIHLIPAP